MQNNFPANRLDVKTFAQAAGCLRGHEQVTRFERLAAEVQGTHANLRVNYTVRGELKHEGQSREQVWLHLRVSAMLPLTCQRCLNSVDVPLSIERSFRFVDTEALAAILDEESEEDVLALNVEFDLLALVEDELLLDLPIVPKHDVCPVPVVTQATDAHFLDAPTTKLNPFSALASLKKGAP